MKYILEIKLLSPVLTSVGEGWGGVVDHDLVFDSIGLPFIPARRIKGLWKDAYQDVFDAWKQSGEEIFTPKYLFGQPGKNLHSGESLFTIQDAHLVDSSMYWKWLEGWMNKIHPNEIRECFSSIRTQTAIDKSTGTPKKDALRQVRVLNKDWVFHTPIWINTKDSDQIVKALSLGALAIRHIGMSRTRGMGRVCCNLLDQNHHNITQSTLNTCQKSLISLKEFPSYVSFSNPTPLPKPKAIQYPTHFLRYQLELNAPAVIPVLESNPNNISTQQYISGRMLWGVFAWKYLKESTPSDSFFTKVFLDGGIRFLSAFPMAENSRSIPIPHSIREEKEEQNLFDLIEEIEQGNPSKRLKGFGQITHNRLYRVFLETTLNYHHQRSQNRKKGRALENDGAFFTYESIQKGEKFCGVILGDEQTLNEFWKSMPDPISLQFGRSKNAQYGGWASLHWIDRTPQSYSEHTEWNGFETPLPHKEEFILVITTLSPMLTHSPNGHPQAYFPQEELEKRLHCSLKMRDSYTRTELVGGYASHLKLPRQQWLAIAPGSVFLYEATQSISKEDLKNLENDGLGLFKGEGFGRIAINRHTHTKLYQEDIPVVTPLKMQGNHQFPSPVQELMVKIIKKRCQKILETTARETYGHKKNKELTPSFISRLLRIIEKNDPDHAWTTIQKLKEQSKLENYTLNSSSGYWPQDLKSKNLKELLEKSLMKGRSVVNELSTKEFKRIFGEEYYSQSCTQISQSMSQEESIPLIKHFLKSFLNFLRYHLKENTP